MGSLPESKYDSFFFCNGDGRSDLITGGTTCAGIL